MATNQAAFNAIVIQIQNNQVASVNLDNVGITDTDCISLANALRNNASVIYLFLGNNSIRASGATVLAQALQVNTALRSLSLQGNTLEASGVTALAQALQVNTALQMLDLQVTSLGASEATVLAQALQVNTALTMLFLNHNSIGDRGAIAFAQALRVNTMLQRLDLDSNSVGDSGAIALAQCLQVNTALISLRLYANSIGVSGAMALAEALQINTALQVLSLNANSIGLSGTAAFAQALQCNYALRTFVRDASSYNYDYQIDTYLGRNNYCPTCPIVTFRAISVPRNTAVTLSAAQLQITTSLQYPSFTSRTPLDGNFTVSAVRNGQFINPQAQVLTQFSQLALNNSQVLLRADDSGLPITCNITASFGDFTTCTIPLVFNITNTLPTTSFNTTSADVTSSIITLTTTSAPITVPASSASLSPTITSAATPSSLSHSISITSALTASLPLLSSAALTTPTSPTIVPAGTGDSSSSGLSPAVFAGAAVGGAALVGVGVYLLYRRRQQQRRVALQAPVPTPFMLTNPMREGNAAFAETDVDTTWSDSTYYTQQGAVPFAVPLENDYATLRATQLLQPNAIQCEPASSSGVQKEWSPATYNVEAQKTWASLYDTGKAKK